MEIGVTVGKFMPMHRGHELMIDIASRSLEEVYVVVSRDPVEVARPGLRDTVNVMREKYAGTNVTILEHIDHSPAYASGEVDQHGTVHNEAFIQYWVQVFRTLVPRATHFVSSDLYGRSMAERLALSWFPVDPLREQVPVSATEIRKDPLANWQYITEEFRRFFAKRIVVVGAESSGKSTLVKDLAQHWHSPAVPEYGRTQTMAVGNRSWKYRDFSEIIERQQYLVDYAVKTSNTGLVFVDTEAYTTHLYAQEYLKGDASADFKLGARFQKYDLAVLVEPNLPWVDDGTRVMPDQGRRQQFVDDLTYLLENDAFASPKLMRLAETDRRKRVQAVSVEVARLLGQPDNQIDFSRLTAESSHAILSKY